MPGTLEQRTERNVCREAAAGYQRIGWLNLISFMFQSRVFFVLDVFV